jgi:hypothetical protein
MELRRAMGWLGVLGLLLVPSLACAVESADASRPLRLALAPEARSADVLGHRADRERRFGAQRGASSRAPTPMRRESVGQRALQGMLEAPDVETLSAAPDDASFRFRRQGNAGRDLRESYKDMCDRVSNRLWDEPNGKRVKFDVAGKPGVAFEIPLH